MGLDRKRLMERRAAMRAAGHWRDETLLDHLAGSLP